LLARASHRDGMRTRSAGEPSDRHREPPSEGGFIWWSPDAVNRPAEGGAPVTWRWWRPAAELQLDVVQLLVCSIDLFRWMATAVNRRWPSMALDKRHPCEAALTCGGLRAHGWAHPRRLRPCRSRASIGPTLAWQAVAAGERREGRRWAREVEDNLTSGPHMLVATVERAHLSNRTVGPTWQGSHAKRRGTEWHTGQRKFARWHMGSLKCFNGTQVTRNFYI
jgi:hypothetical protein